MFMASMVITEWITGAELAHRIGVTPRWVYELIGSGLPCDRSRAAREGQVPWPEALEWYIRYRAEWEARRAAPRSLQESRRRKIEAEARIALIEADRKEESLILLEHSDAAIELLLDTLVDRLEHAAAEWPAHLVGCETIPQAVARLQPLSVLLVHDLRDAVMALPEREGE
ncbi:MAG: hypothetical protein R3E10_02705 [Gemmatimonadota bacterium]